MDGRELTRGLFEVHACKGHKPPPTAYVAIKLRGYWYYIDDRDQASKSTLALVLQLSRLDFGTQKATGPILTLPVGAETDLYVLMGPPGTVLDWTPDGSGWSRLVPLRQPMWEGCGKPTGRATGPRPSTNPQAGCGHRRETGVVTESRFLNP